MLDFIILVFSDTCFESKYGRTLVFICSEPNNGSVIFHGPLLGCIIELETGLGRTATLGIVGIEFCNNLGGDVTLTTAGSDKHVSGSCIDVTGSTTF